MSEPIIVLADGTPHVLGGPFTPDIDLIARALSHINRYTGHVGAYSVAQHCCMVSDVLRHRYWQPVEVQLAGLLHDAPEAYIGDVSAPLKRLLTGYRELEDHYHGVIDSHFNVETEAPIVKEVDALVLSTEAHAFGLPKEHFPAVWPLETEAPIVKEVDVLVLSTEAHAFVLPKEHFPAVWPLEWDGEKWPAEQARVEFLARFARLTGEA